MGVLLRSLWARSMSRSSTDSNRPRSSMAATHFSRACAKVSPSYGAPAALMVLSASEPAAVARAVAGLRPCQVAAELTHAQRTALYEIFG